MTRRRRLTRANAPTAAMGWVGGLILLSSLPDIAFRSATGARFSPIWIPILAVLLLLLSLVVAASGHHSSDYRDICWRWSHLHRAISWSSSSNSRVSGFPGIAAWPQLAVSSWSTRQS